MTALHIFDFDDTLAKTTGEIRFLLSVGGADWPGAEAFFAGHRTSARGVAGPHGTVWCVRVEELPHIEDEIDALPSKGVSVEKDFSDFARVGEGDYSLKDGIVSILKGVVGSASPVYILTARSGGRLKSLLSPEGWTQSTNPQDIGRILAQVVGTDIPVFAVGAPGVNTAEEKRKKIAELLQQIRPDVLHFWDDDRRNLDAVLRICGTTGTRLICHKIDPHSSRVQSRDTCEAFVRLVEGDMPDDQVVEYLYRAITSRAERMRSTSLEACDFLEGDRYAFMNDTVFPAYEDAGSPEPYTEGCLEFTGSFFPASPVG